MQWSAVAGLRMRHFLLCLRLQALPAGGTCSHTLKGVTLKALAQLDGCVVLHFLPPYCPEGDRIERVWLDLHANVTRNHRCRTLARLMERVHAYLAGRNAQRSASPSLRRGDLRRTA